MATTKSLPRLFSLLAAGTVLGLVIAEIAMRSLLPATYKNLILYGNMESERNFCRYDPLLGWAGIENAAGDFEWADTRHHVRQNRYGNRGGEYDWQRSAKRRMLVLGDSFTWGFGVEEEDIFTSVMERQAGGSLEMVNTGVSGYGTDQEYLLWKEKGHLWQPDAVILMVTPYTDLGDNLYPDRYGYQKPLFEMDALGELNLTNVPVPQRTDPWVAPPQKVSVTQPAWVRALLLHSMAANVILNASLRSPGIRTFLESHELIPTRLAGYDWEPLMYYQEPEQEVTSAVDLMLALIRKIHLDVTKRGASFYLCIVPSIVQVYPDLWEQFLRDSSNSHPIDTMAPEALNTRITEWCAKNGIRVIDLLPGLREAGRTNPYLYYPLNRHWTREGHETVANLLLKASL